MKIQFGSLRLLGLELAVGAALVGSSGPVQAAWPTDPMVNVPICRALGNHPEIDVAPDGEHGAILAWKDFRPGAVGAADIYAQRVDSTGTVLWPTDGALVCNAAGQQFRPRVIPDGSGGAIVVWRDFRASATTGTDLYAQRLDAAGVPRWTPNGVVVCNEIDDQGGDSAGEISVASDGAGGVLVLWPDWRRRNLAYPDNVLAMFAQRISATGVPLWGANGVRVSDPNLYCAWPSIFPDGGGGALIHHHIHDINNQSALRSGLVARHLGPSGATIWTALPCTDSDGSPTRCPANWVTASPDGAGGVVCAWLYVSAAPTEILAQRVDGTGAVRWATDGMSLLPSGQPNSHLHAVPDGAQGAIVAWVDYRSARAEIYAQRVNALGNIQWATNGVLVNTAPGSGAQASTYSMVEDGAGGVLLAWTDRRFSSTELTLWAQRLSGLGTPLWAADGAIASTPNAYGPYGVVSDGLQRGIVGWQDNRGGVFDIYAQRVPLFGTPVSAPELIGAEALGHPAPNPAVQQTRIPLHLAAEVRDGRDARLTLYDVHGRRVRSWSLLPRSGEVVTWDGTDDFGRALPAGVYAVKLTKGGRQVGPGRRIVWLPR
jgi:hypothetical protein